MGAADARQEDACACGASAGLAERVGRTQRGDGGGGVVAERGRGWRMARVHARKGDPGAGGG